MLIDDFFYYLKEAFSKKYFNLERKETAKWFKCYERDRTICWMQKPNKDGSFWVFISIPSEDILRNIKDLRVQHIDNRKCRVCLENVRMSAIDVTDRGKSASGGWERSWPLGFKIKDSSQFELGKIIILLQ